MLRLVKITAKEMEKANYCGSRGGAIRGTHWALFEDGKGFCSLDGKTTFTMKGKMGMNSMQKIIDDGGFCGEIAYLPCI